jgi:hypothetical protein
MFYRVRRAPIHVAPPTKPSVENLAIWCREGVEPHEVALGILSPSSCPASSRSYSVPKTKTVVECMWESGFRMVLGKLEWLGESG